MHAYTDIPKGKTERAPGRPPPFCALPVRGGEGALPPRGLLVLRCEGGLAEDPHAGLRGEAPALQPVQGGLAEGEGEGVAGL